VYVLTSAYHEALDVNEIQIGRLIDMLIYESIQIKVDQLTVRKFHEKRWNRGFPPWRSIIGFHVFTLNIIV
jgi:hypothetical protein